MVYCGKNLQFHNTYFVFCHFRAVTISSAARSHPSSIAMRYLQRKAIMLDPAWHKGHYYLGEHYPKLGMKLARYKQYTNLYNSRSSGRRNILFALPL